MKVVKNVVETTVDLKEEKELQLGNLDTLSLEEAEVKVKELFEEYTSKTYSVDLSLNDLKILYNFISIDAPWTFRECLGIVEVLKELDRCITAGAFVTTGVALEAVFYYLSKVEGKGQTPKTESIKSVSDYIRIIKTVTTALEKVKVDSEVIKKAEFIMTAKREGIALETDCEPEQIDTKE